MKKSSIIANLVVSCVFLAISLVLLIAAPCFGIFCFAIALTFTIIYSVKLSDYNKQQNNYYQNQMQGNYNPNVNQNFNPYPPQKKSNTAMIVTLVLIGSSAVTCCLMSSIASKSYIKKSKENSVQTEQKIENTKEPEAYQNLKIGNSVTVNGLKITVNSISETQYNSETAYIVNITYKNNTDEKLTIYPYNWKAVMGEDLEAHYADVEEDFTKRYLQKNKEFTTNLIFYKERRGETANEIKCDLSAYESDLYATWLIPEDISTESTTIITTGTTTSTTTETTTVVTTEAPTEPPTENQMIDVYINAEPIILDNGKVKFKVETNLPDEAELTLRLCRDDFVVSNDAKVTVKNSVGESSELFKFSANENDGLVSGDYKLIISMYSSKQSGNVKKVIGEKGEYLKGSIVEKSEYSDDYNVYKTEQITLTFAGTEETAEYININLLEDMFAQIEHRINYIEVSNTYYIQIWYEGLGDRLDAGMTKSSDHSYDVTSLCKSALELCQANDPESSVYLEVVDDRDEDTLIIYSLDGCPAIAVY